MHAIIVLVAVFSSSAVTGQQQAAAGDWFAPFEAAEQNFYRSLGLTVAPNNPLAATRQWYNNGQSYYLLGSGSTPAIPSYGLGAGGVRGPSTNNHGYSSGNANANVGYGGGQQQMQFNSYQQQSQWSGGYQQQRQPLPQAYYSQHPPQQGASIYPS